MTIFPNKVNVMKRYWEAPLNLHRRDPPYRWNGAISTADILYLELPVLMTDETVVAHKPSTEYLKSIADRDGREAQYYYVCEFQMSDFDLYGKVSTDMCCNETGKDYYLDLIESKYFSQCENPLEEEEDTMFIQRYEDGTFHLNTGFELLAELQERGYNGKVWAVVADYAT